VGSLAFQIAGLESTFTHFFNPFVLHPCSFMGLLKCWRPWPAYPAGILLTDTSLAATIAFQTGRTGNPKITKEPY
jgi:hypothetical protein